MLKEATLESTKTASAYPRRKMMHEINNRLNTLHLGITLVSQWDDPELQRLGEIMRAEIENLEALVRTAVSS